MLGAWAALAQVVLVREGLGVCGGNELAVALGLAGWLAGVGLGALLCGAFRDRAALLAPSAVLAGPAALLGLAALRLDRVLLGVPAGGDPGLGALAVVLFAGLGLGGLGVGLLFTASAAAAPGKEGSPVTRLYLAEAAGALASGLLFAFVLAGRVAPVPVAFAGAALPLAAVALVRPSLASRVACTGLSLAFLAAAFAGPAARLDRALEARAFTSLGAGALAAAAESPYGRLALGRSEGQSQLVADGRVAFVFPDPWDRPVPVHLAMTEHPRPRRVLLVGGGPTDRLEAALAHEPSRVVLTVLDERVLALIAPFLPAGSRAALADPRVEIAHDDGRRYVGRTSERFDVVFVDAGAPVSARANRYYTHEFFESVRRILEPGGSVTVTLPGGATVLAPEAARFAATVLATLGSVFAHVVVVPGVETTFHAASQGKVITDSAAELARRFDARGARSGSFTSRRFGDLLDAGRMAEALREMRGQPAALNTDARPLAYLAGMELWERSVSAPGRARAPTWTGLAERFAILFLVAPLAAWLPWQARRLGRGTSGRGEAVFSIATTGAAGMAVEVAVLIAYETAAGTLYTGIALLTALFMAGLGLGGYAALRLVPRRPAVAGVAADAAVLALLLASGPLLALAADAPALIAFWSLAAGAVTGAAFPALLGRAAAPADGDERKAASSIEAADHLGASLGALVTGAIWLPVFGVARTCLLFVALKAAALLGQLVAVRRARVPN
jgi:spermidine synthase